MNERAKLIKKYALNGLILFGLVLLYSVISSIFLIADNAFAVKIIVSLIVWSITLLTAFLKGSLVATKDYKKAQSLLSQVEKSEFRAVKISIISSFYYLISFIIPLIILLIIGIVVKTGVFGVISYIFLISIAWFGSVEMIDVNILSSFFIYFGYCIIICAAFSMGYFFKVEKEKRVRREIASELRSFKN